MRADVDCVPGREGTAMTAIRLTLCLAPMLGILFVAGRSNAAIYQFDGTVTVCTSTCDSFASFDVNAVFSATYEIDVLPGESWGLSEVMDFDAELDNPVAPAEPFDGTNPTTANPLPLTPAIAPVRAMAQGLTTGGTTDASNTLVSGNLLHEFTAPPFSSNSAWLILAIASDGSFSAKLCLFYPTAGCIPGATESMVIEGQTTLVPEPSAAALFVGSLIGLGILSHRYRPVRERSPHEARGSALLQ